MASRPVDERVQLELKPRLCTLSEGEASCETLVQLTWKARKKQSLCLKVVNKPNVHYCWKQYSKGAFDFQLEFKDDLVVELRDSETQSLVAKQTINVVREADVYRQKRRQPWDLFQ